jgi:hypothetical protein
MPVVEYELSPLTLLVHALYAATSATARARLRHAIQYVMCAGDEWSSDMPLQDEEDVVAGPTGGLSMN